MRENQNNKSYRSKRHFSLEEKRSYYIEWKKSELKTTDFCKTHGISKSALYQWNKEFTKEDTDVDFAPLVLKNQPLPKQTDMVQLNFDFPNHMQLSIQIPEHRLVSFIHEVSYATTAVR